MSQEPREQLISPQLESQRNKIRINIYYITEFS